MGEPKHANAIEFYPIAKASHMANPQVKWQEEYPTYQEFMAKIPIHTISGQLNMLNQ